MESVRYYGPYRIIALIPPHCKIETLDGRKVEESVPLAEIHPANGRTGAPVYPAEDMLSKSNEKKTEREKKNLDQSTETAERKRSRKRQKQQGYVS